MGTVALLERKYAGALLACAEEQKVGDDIARQIRVLAETLAQPDLQKLLANPQLGKQKKLSLLCRLNGNPEGIFHNFLALVVERRRESLLPGICHHFCLLHLESQGTREGVLETTYPPGPETVNLIATQLAEAFGLKKVLLTVHQNPDLLAGMRVTIGGRLIDASVAGRLAELKNRLLGLPL